MNALAEAFEQTLVSAAPVLRILMPTLLIASMIYLFINNRRHKKN